MVIKGGPRWLSKTGKNLSLNILNWVLFATVYIAYVTMYVCLVHVLDLVMVSFQPTSLFFYGILSDAKANVS